MRKFYIGCIVLGIMTALVGCVTTKGTSECDSWEPVKILPTDSTDEMMAKLEENTHMQSVCDIYKA